MPPRTRLPLLALLLAACTAAGSGTTQRPAPATASAAAPADQPWPVKTREHVDLWLHGFAMLGQDTARLPLFRRAYLDSLTAERARLGVSTLLDANRDRLRARFAVNRALMSAQFLPLYFDGWDEMKRATALFLQVRGDARAANDQYTQQILLLLAQTFPTAADRDWLELFVRSLDDERAKFYHDHWTREQQARRPALAAADSLWQRVYRPRLQRFLNNTEQETGEILLSLPLGGEGRTVTLGKRRNAVAVDFPARADEAREAIYGIAHEVVGVVTATAVNDNTTPAERREGIVDAYLSAGLVRGGAMLLERTAPELVDGYARYYLAQAGRAATADPRAALATAFPLPPVIADAIGRQLDVVLGGI